ncbi:MAG: antitoxin VapB family protein [Halobacteriales archaeon]
MIHFNDAFFGLSADLSQALETDDIDLLDVHMLSPGIGEAVFEAGVLLVGSKSACAVEENRQVHPSLIHVPPFVPPKINAVVNRCLRMGTKMVRLDEGLYERIEAHKRDDESFSEAIDRLIDDYTLLDFAGGYTEEDAEHHRELLERSETEGRRTRREMLERMDIETDDS